MSSATFWTQFVNPFKRLRKRLGTSKVPPPCDTTDFAHYIPTAPTAAQLYGSLSHYMPPTSPDGGAGNTSTSSPSSAGAPPPPGDMLTRGAFFDLKYRCGTEGRCACCRAQQGGSTRTDSSSETPPPACRFPSCFAMRPISKGAEVWSARLQFELRVRQGAVAVVPKDSHLVPLETVQEWVRRVADEDALAEVVTDVERVLQPLQWRMNHTPADEKEEAERYLAVAGGGLSLGSDSAVPTGHHPAARLTEEAVTTGVSEDGTTDNHESPPLSTHLSFVDFMAAVYCWRAALLVNLRRDESAVNSLLNMIRILSDRSPPKAAGGGDHGPPPSWHSTVFFLYESAVTWATLNDMEIIVYRSMTHQFAPFSRGIQFATERPLLLPRVFTEVVLESQKHGATRSSSPLGRTLPEWCAQVVLHKEVAAVVSRIQSAQVYGDLTEEPMESLCLPMTLSYYRFMVHAVFWRHFLHCLCLPVMTEPTPSPPAGDSERPEGVAAAGADHHHTNGGGDSSSSATPPRASGAVLLDTIGRSVMLHHLVVFAETRMSEVASGAVADRVHKRLRSLAREEGEGPTPVDYDMVLTPKEMHIAKSRLAEMLRVITEYENGGGKLQDLIQYKGTPAVEH